MLKCLVRFGSFRKLPFGGVAAAVEKVVAVLVSDEIEDKVAEFGVRVSS